MKTTNTIQQKWSISKELERKFDEKTLLKCLRSFNKMSGGSYFFFDNYRQKLLVDTSESRILCGYPQSLAEKDGFDFFKHILNKKDQNWLMKLWQLSTDLFFSLDAKEREDFVLLYDVNAKMKNGKKTILHFKVVPHQLCKNGNLWLALGCVSQSLMQEIEYQACIINRKSEMRYDLVDGAFAGSKIASLKSTEETILLLLSKNMSESDICKTLGILKGKYHRIKTGLFQKLSVSTPAGAILRAHQLGII